MKGQGGRKKAKPKTPFVWLVEHQDAFATLRDTLLSPPVLAFPDHSLPFVLHVDASKTGLGAELYQRSDKLQVIGYGSRILKSSEKNYSVH